jgi:hypothetical protein|tara:strand:- start:171 stop:272 length:102 start_codon:yes stop_codon:yes gene_type:complete
MNLMNNERERTERERIGRRVVRRGERRLSSRSQ